MLTNLIQLLAVPVQSSTDHLSVVRKYLPMTSRSHSLHRCQQCTVHLHKKIHHYFKQYCAFLGLTTLTNEYFLHVNV